MAARLRILFIDAYDSFSNNIVALLEKLLDVKVTKIYIDAQISDLPTFLTPFAAIICGPGPGHPKDARDVGLMESIWRLADDETIPVLGICLGFQSLVHEFGGIVKRLPHPRHGIETEIVSLSTSIFKGLPALRAVQYHSLHASLGYQDCAAPGLVSLWVPTETCSSLLPLAWDLSSASENDLDFQGNPGAILMAVQHAEKPFYGVQFHPESICSHQNARHVVTNWWQIAKDWLQTSRPHKLVETSPEYRDVLPPSEAEILVAEQFDASGTSSSRGSSPLPSSLASSLLSEPTSPDFASKTLPLGLLDVPTICKALHLGGDELIILDSEMRQLPRLAESSIIGIVEADTIKIKYSIGTRRATLQQGNQKTQLDLQNYGGDFFAYLKAFMEDRIITNHNDIAFCGGLMGYITYEACLETIGVHAPSRPGGADICFAFVERSIVLDHKARTLSIQSLRPDDTSSKHNWLSETFNLLESLASERSIETYDTVPSCIPNKSMECCIPVEADYKTKISQCQAEIHAGNSYELCLTDQTSIWTRQQTNTVTSGWERYLNLRQLNPAPFAAYIRLDSLTLLSTSPERFMCWSAFQPSASADRHVATSTCQFRPIKGTVRKQQKLPDGRAHQVSLEEATAILSTRKERAENLMIVDLIRHDLHGVASFRDVDVKALMVVEEYQHVYQLVSVIEGTLFRPFQFASSPSCPPTPQSRPLHPPASVKTGIDALAVSLPPGSMTGAPKRRSCQLLREIEGNKPRSIYSGVVGYMCVSGKGDFSVVIRSAYRWDDDSVDGREKWNIGAGGAVTTLSTEDGEWEEMLTKLHSTLGLFTQAS